MKKKRQFYKLLVIGWSSITHCYYLHMLETQDLKNCISAGLVLRENNEA